MPRLPDSDPIWQQRLEPVFLLYAALCGAACPQAGLGGILVWSGELDDQGCDFMRAANIAGAASLGCTADAAALRHANRDGVADFLVTSLDEALRILKNEIRKHQPVSVAVSAEPSVIAREMQDRGVLPDLLPPLHRPTAEDLPWFLHRGSRRIEPQPLPQGWSFRAWSSPPAAFDATASAVLREDDHLNRRWLRLSPRYLGPSARRVRSLACSLQVEAQLAGRDSTEG